MHWVNWSKVTKPKNLGGLGLQTAKGRNTALLAKLNWRMHTEGNAPWSKVLKLKYCTRQRINSRNATRLACSPTWKGLRKGEEVFKKGVKRVPGHDSKLNFWYGCWSDLGPLRNLIQGPLPRETEILKIRDVCFTSGWDWSIIPFELPLEIKASVQAVPIPFFVRSGDKLAWKFSLKGDFDARSAYLLASDYQDTNTFDGTWIWKLCTLPKIQMFMWKCLHQAIGVKECMVARGMQLNGSCPMCNAANESIIHALRDCNVVKPTWHLLGVHSSNTNFFSQGITDWLNTNAKSKWLASSNHPPWNVLFPFSIWLIWHQRNQMVFKGKGANPHLAKNIFMQATEYALCINRPNRNQTRMIR